MIQTHFHPTGKPEREQSTLAIYLAEKPTPNLVTSFVVGDRDLDIPAGEKHYVKEDSINVPRWI